MNKITIKDRIIEGRKSTFSYCCIMWYFLRLYYLNLRYGEAVPVIVSPKIKDNDIYHVMCPFCTLYYKINKRQCVYGYCIDCDWMQFKTYNCNLCNKNMVIYDIRTHLK